MAPTRALRARGGHGAGGAALGAGPAVAVLARVMSRPLPSIVKPEQAVTLPKLIGERYLLERRLGRGGMADVYLATDRVLERKVAIKLMRQGANQPASVERFHREAVTLASSMPASTATARTW
jgi:hypothetical protein